MADNSTPSAGASVSDAKATKKLEKQLSRMPVAPGRLSYQQLQVAYWYVRNRSLLYQVCVVFLLFVNAIVWTVNFSIGALALIDLPSYRRVEQSLVTPGIDWPRLHAVDQPQNLQLSDIQRFSGNNNRFDYVSRIVNPNKQWAATVEYEFVTGALADTSQRRSVVVLPEEDKYIMALGQESGGGTAQVQLVRVRWQRVSPPTYTNFYNERFNFTVSSTTVESIAVGLNQRPATRATFTVTNNSGFGYWNAGFIVLLGTNNSFSAVNYVTVQQLKAGESRPMEAIWYENLPPVRQITVIPEVNILDPNVFLPVGGIR